MQSSDAPGKIAVPFAQDAGPTFARDVPVDAPSEDDGSASLTLGFPPLTFLDPAVGGVPVDGRDLNGILRQVTGAVRWTQAGGVPKYDAAFQSEIGGYPAGAEIASAVSDGVWWRSTVNNNMTNPDSGGAGWVSADAPDFSIFPTIAALRATVSGFDLVHVKGYRAPGDGGEGGFRLDSSDTTSADDGGSVIVTASGRRYKREFGAGPISVKQFGARGNGTSDDTATFQAAEAAAGVGAIYVPEGTYLLTGYVPIGRFYGPGSGRVSVYGGTARAFTFPAAPDAWWPGRGLGEMVGRMSAGVAVKVACYGDSTTDGNATTGWTANPVTVVDGVEVPVGTGDHASTAPNAWPAKAEVLLRTYHKNNYISFFNAGYSGKRMDNGWAYNQFERAIINNPAYGVPDMVLIAFGLNDIAQEGSVLSDHVSETEKLIKKCIGYGILPVLLTCDANWRSIDEATTSGGLSAAGRDNTEAARQLDAAKVSLAQKYGLEVIDLGKAEQAWLTENDDGFSFGSVQSDGLHFGDTGHAFKASYVSYRLMRDIYVADGSRVVRIHWQDSRTNYSQGHDEYYRPAETPDQLGANDGDSRFPWFFRMYAGSYTANQFIFDAWVWCEGGGQALVARWISNGGIDRTVAAGDWPRITVRSGVTWDVYDANTVTPNSGADEIKHPTDRPYFICKLKHGLNRVVLAAPGVNTTQFYGGWFEVNRNWRHAGNSYFFPNTRAPTFWQANALRDAGPIEMEYTASAGSDQPVAFLFAEAPDGNNCADYGYNGRQVDILCEGIFPQDTGLLLFGGKSVSIYDTSTVQQQDNCILLLNADATGTFAMYHLFNTAGTHPSDLIVAGTAGRFGSDTRKFMITFKRLSAQQVITMYAGWDISAPVVFTWTGDKTNQLPGAGVMGGLYFKCVTGTTRLARISSLLVRKYV